MEILAHNGDTTTVLVNALTLYSDVKALMQTCKIWHAAIGMWALQQGSDLDKIQLLPTHVSAVPITIHVITEEEERLVLFDIFHRCHGHVHNRKLARFRIGYIPHLEKNTNLFGSDIENRIWMFPELLRNWAHAILQKKVSQIEPLDPVFPMFLEPIQECLELNPSAETLQVKDAQFWTRSPFGEFVFLSKYLRYAEAYISIEAPNKELIYLQCVARDWTSLIQILERRPVCVRDSQIKVIYPETRIFDQ